MKELTLGMRRVGLSFNPSKSDDVNQVKKQIADLLDLLESYKDDEFSEKNRTLSIAQTELETASMYAVKSFFK